MQVFIRGSAGISLIDKLLKLEFSQGNTENIKILRATALLNQFNQLQAKKAGNKGDTSKTQISDPLKPNSEINSLLQRVAKEIAAMNQEVLS